jgi:DNA invertase Pin-like site-specific DNA recombinase
MPTKAIAYYRTSSATNVGEDKDSEARQKRAVEAYAKRAGYEIVASFYDAAVSGADPVDVRPGFAEMLRLIAGNGVRVILVESADRFARDLMVQEAGYAYLQKLGVKLVSVASPEAFLSDTPSAVLMRQMFGAISQFERAMVVAKLKGARDRKRKATGAKVEGRKTYLESVPETVALAKRLAREPLNNRRRSLRGVAAALQGHVSVSGKPYGPDAIARMIDQASGKRRRLARMVG